jgi:exoribonuclease R
MNYKLTPEGICCSKTFEKVERPIDISKMFINDSFDESGNIILSPTRSNTYIPGVLDLRRTYGKENKKFLYLCRPDDKRLPFFYVPYDIPYSFDKLTGCIYITFQYKHWNYTFPCGTITQNFGNVNESNNFYEYILYCKSLNVSIQSFTKESIQKMKHYQPEKTSIIPFRNAKVFTIDSKDSIDRDDGLSIDDEKVSIYITLVPFVLDILDLWDSFTTRISTIYLPDKKRPMIPCILAQLCSLVEKSERCCLALDLFHNGTIELNVCRVKIFKNFGYSDTELNDFESYRRLLEISGCKSSYDLITHYMIKYNKITGEMIEKGIYKTVYKPDIAPAEVLPAYFKQYSQYEYEGDYLQITSPIRRLVDILNMYQICKEKNLIQFSEKANTFYDIWYNKIDYMNISMRHIRQVQNKCKMLSLFETHQYQQFNAYFFDRIERSDGRYKYNVYIPELELSSRFTHSDKFDDYSQHLVTIYVFHDESMLKKKIKLQIYKE